MKLHKYILIILIIATSTLFVACTSETYVDQEYSQLITEKVKQVDDQKIICYADIITLVNASQNECGFLLGTIQNPIYGIHEQVSINNVDKKGRLKLEMTYSFSKNKEYYIRSFIKTEDMMVYGNSISFTIEE